MCIANQNAQSAQKMQMFHVARTKTLDATYKALIIALVTSQQYGFRVPRAHLLGLLCDQEPFLPKMIFSIFKAVWMCLNPAYRRKVERDYGFYKAISICHYLCTKPDADRNDLDAARIVNNLAKTLI
jgi:hypothetical protein